MRVGSGLRSGARCRGAHRNCYDAEQQVTVKGVAEGRLITGMCFARPAVQLCCLVLSTLAHSSGASPVLFSCRLLEREVHAHALHIHCVLLTGAVAACRCITKLFPTRSHTVAAQGGINAALANMSKVLPAAVRSCGPWSAGQAPGRLDAHASLCERAG